MKSWTLTGSKRIRLVKFGLCDAFYGHLLNLAGDHLYLCDFSFSLRRQDKKKDYRILGCVLAGI